MSPRICRVLRQALQHDAVPLLRLQRRVQLRQQERQVLLALDEPSNTDDARERGRHQAVHIEMRRLRGARERHSRAQPELADTALPRRLGEPLDWVQLCYGQILLVTSKLFIQLEQSSRNFLARCLVMCTQG